ncbi:septum formation protein [Synechococcus sp. BIOS-E4-1]|uniref:Maf family protein n=1 Tax=Synechococcus sp. BIOS-E4-1 TaxID=1400864 RepID=UPI0016493149|nr:nucleoside triphosphate pyrophosphatase [Synechococcus sp. BIOS-E4-1]QNI55528.1 septum formation protein [Synechococcus sp. BIOS-E4-1]
MLLLASASPARRRLLEQAAIPHRVQISGVDEEAIQDSDPTELVRRLAQAKASAVRSQLNNAGITAVLGCDSLFVFAGQVYGKPADSAQALERWQQMRGSWGDLHTGHCLMTGPGATSQQPLLACVTTRVLFADLSNHEIEAYVASGEPLRCAGGFALEGLGGSFVERLDGCYSNVIGLSLPLLRRWLPQV